MAPLVVKAQFQTNKLAQRVYFVSFSGYCRFGAFRMSTLTREEAGRKAQELALERYGLGSPTYHPQEQSIETVLAHAGIDRDDANAAMSPLLQFATTYGRPADGNYRPHDAIYSREDNRTRLLLEREMAQLECRDLLGLTSNPTSTSCAFSSGMMAASAIVLAHQAPVHVLLPQDLYHGVRSVLSNVFQRFGVSVHFFDATSLSSVEYELQKLPRDNVDCILWMETPSNPRCYVIDVSEVCKVAKSVNPRVTTVVDSTLAPPTIQLPLSLGADLVMHSATKYIGGHSDLTAGIVTASPITERGQELGIRLREVLTAMGGVASPMDSWLALRGLRTLALRVQRQSQNALKMALFLQEHVGGGLISAVHYPGLEVHPQHEIAKKQMLNGLFGGVLSFEMSSETHAFAFAGAVQTIHRATSLGGTETLIEHRASIEPPEKVVSPPGLLRISAGLEDENDLVKDLSRALDIVREVHEGLS